MERHVERDLELLTAIGEGRPVTQRALAERLGVALGLTNLYLKRLATKGYIKIVEFPRKPAAGSRLRYLLTAKGISEKTRLTYDHMTHALALYKKTRQTLREALALLRDGGMKRVALYGTGEAAELAYLTLREFGLDAVAVYSRDGGGEFLGFPVRSIAELRDGSALRDGTIDRIIVATFDRAQPHVAELEALGIPVDALVTLRRITGASRPRRSS